MTAQVTVLKSNRNSQSEVKLPFDVLFYDDAGFHLYEVGEGDNWENKKHVQEIHSYQYRIEEDGVFSAIEAEYGYIQYASKAIRPGDLIQVVSQYKGQEENFLVIEPTKTESEGFGEFGEGVSVMEQNQGVFLLSIVGKQPYMEGQIRSILSISDTYKIYNLNEISIFFTNIPFISVLFVFIIIFIILWGYSCRLSCHLYKNRYLLVGNFGIAFILLIVFVWIISKIHLPSSLLPDKNIFDLQYYKNEFLEIFQALEKLSGTAVLEAEKVLKQNVLLAKGIFLFSLLCCISILLLEHKIVKNYK